MSTVLAAIIFLGICIFGMCFNIIFRKNGKFPEYEVSQNENMRKMGIKCMHEQEAEMRRNSKRQQSASCTGEYSDACSGCGLYPYEKFYKEKKK